MCIALQLWLNFRLINSKIPLRHRVRRASGVTLFEWAQKLVDYYLIFRPT